MYSIPKVFLMQLLFRLVGYPFRGYSKANLRWTPTLNVYSAVTASNNVPTLSDYNRENHGTTPFSSDITYANWSVTAYNIFTLNAAGIANILKNAQSKFCIRDNYDATNTAPPGSAHADFVMRSYYSEGGAGYKPELDVTYTTPSGNNPTYTFGTTTGQTLTVSNNLLIGDGVNPITVTATTNNSTIDVNGNITISGTSTFAAPPSSSFTVGRQLD